MYFVEEIRISPQTDTVQLHHEATSTASLLHMIGQYLAARSCENVYSQENG